MSLQDWVETLDVAETQDKGLAAHVPTGWMVIWCTVCDYCVSTTKADAATYPPAVWDAIVDETVEHDCRVEIAARVEHCGHVEHCDIVAEPVNNESTPPCAG